ncbi:Nose resistant to fluoxetine protein 6 [Toxocara canis]|uniref:Nose resistant to fluoxetine protein 6 n=1 Tax=Toxocara canis TaxID=6265 RepID=A0A0B2V5N7_TOXCA|nr:Nose resistant to fluoxetine protein 6 [Toxocara canis]
MNLLLLLVGFSICRADHLSTLPTSAISRFIESVSQDRNLKVECKRDLTQIESIIAKHKDGSQRLQHFFSAFRFGEAYFLETRDRDRWMYASTECIEAAGESTFFASEHPLLFCHGYDIDMKEEIAFGMCMPASCEGDHLLLLNEWRLFATSSADENDINYAECMRSRMIYQWYQRVDSLAVFFVLVALMGLVGVATAYHIRSQRETSSRFEQLLLAFSAKRNIEIMMRRPKASNSIVSCLDGLRVQSLFWITAGHALWFLPSFTENVDELKKDFANFSNLWITNFLLAVDTFFVLSATLTSFHFFRSITSKGDKPELRSLSYWLRFYRHRFLRLWPTSVFVLWILTFGISLAHHYAAWPPTDPYIQCTKHGWENVFLLSSLTNNRCYGWTWYISADFILFLSSPLFLLALKHSTKRGIILSLIVTLISCFLNAIQIIRYNFPPTQMLFVQPPVLNQHYMQHEVLIYNPPQYRIGAYVIGLCLGYLLSGYREPSGASLSLRAKCYGWIGSFILGLVALCGLYPAVQGWNWPIYNVIYGSIHRILWSLSIAWIIYACHYGFGGIINSFLSCSIFMLLSPLSYSAFLMHMVPVFGFYLNFSFPIIYSGTTQIIVFCAIQIILTLLCALIVVLIFEIPSLNIERIFLLGKYSEGKSTFESTRKAKANFLSSTNDMHKKILNKIE